MSIKLSSFGFGIPEGYRQVLFVAAVIGLALYSTAIVVVGLMPVIAPTTQQSQPIIYATCCALSILHAFACITADPGWVTRSIGDKSTLNGRTRCHTCNAVRPPRAHHCQHCGRCCLRWDHHCTWMNICVGRRNYKHYYMMILFATLAHVYFTALVVSALVHGLVDVRVVLASLVMLPTGLISAYLLFWHTLLAARNLTTVEWVMLHAPRRALRPRRANDCSDDDADDDEVLPSRHPAAGRYLPRPNTPAASAGLPSPPAYHRSRSSGGGSVAKAATSSIVAGTLCNNTPNNSGPGVPPGVNNHLTNPSNNPNNNAQQNKIQITPINNELNNNHIAPTSYEDEWSAGLPTNGSSSNSSPTTPPMARRVVPLNIMSPNTIRTVWAGVQRGQRQRCSVSGSSGGGRVPGSDDPAMVGVTIDAGCPSSSSSGVQERASGFLSGLRDAFGHNIFVWLLPVPPVFPSACGGVAECAILGVAYSSPYHTTAHTISLHHSS